LHDTLGQKLSLIGLKSDLASKLITKNPSQARLEIKDVQKVETPNQRTIEQVATFLNVENQQCIKTLVFNVDEELVLVLSRGDHEVNDIKVKNALQAKVVEFATEEEIQSLLQCEVGSLGPVNLPNGVKVIADHAVASIRNGICGANVAGFHLVNVNPERDFVVNQYEDLRFIKEGDPSPDGRGTIIFAKGIEVGHVFKLGTTYSEPMNGTFLDNNGRSQPYIMGCYGIGVSRVMAAVAEQFQDDKGFIWPSVVSPYDVHLVPVNMKDDAQVSLADDLYKLLKSNRFDVLYDDRPERAGVKFADSDLIGLPIRITIGKKAVDGLVEVKIRNTGETFEWKNEEILDHLQTFFSSLDN